MIVFPITVAPVHRNVEAIFFMVALKFPCLPAWDALAET